MSLHLHHLTGCAPTPLAHYLKALGVLRIVGEQADPQARGWWQDEHFCLLSNLDRDQLEAFFLERYQPSPMFNPWGARSGYYPGPSETAARKALEQIERCTQPRVGPFRDSIRIVRDIIRQHGGAKPEEDADTALMLQELRNRLRGPSRDWLDTVKVLVNDLDRSPAILGTGGNEGSGGYVSSYMSAVVACIIKRSEDHALGLFASEDDTTTRPAADYRWNGSFGQFMPDSNGSAWDLLLALEGALFIRSSVTMSAAGNNRFLSSPFYFSPLAAGAGSSGKFDELVMNKGRSSPGRGEQWLPLWSSPATAMELARLFSEGTCTIGRVRALNSLDAARAILQLGAARGFDHFIRYGYLQRNNQATHFAVPLGRVTALAQRHSRLVDDLSPWMVRLHRAARERAPARLEQVERRLCDRVLDALVHDDTPARWQAILLAAVEVEEVQRSGVALNVGPIPSLSPDWLRACDDGTATWRLAMALGSAAAHYDAHGRAIDPVRCHWLPLKRGGRAYDIREKRLVHSPRLVIRGRDALDDCVALLERRLIEAKADAQRSLPLVSAPGYEAQLEDLAALLDGSVELDRVLALARALMAVRWREARERVPVRSVRQGAAPDEAWMALRLAHLAGPLTDGVRIPVDEAIVRRLDSGDAAAAIELALRHVRSAGLRPPLVAATTSPATARLWASALVFPIHRRTARDLARRFVPRNSKEN